MACRLAAPPPASVKKYDKLSIGGECERLKPFGIDLQSQFLTDFANRRIPRRFPGFQFPTGEFPQSAMNTFDTPFLQEYPARSIEQSNRDHEQGCREICHLESPV